MEPPVAASSATIGQALKTWLVSTDAIVYTVRSSTFTFTAILLSSHDDVARVA